MMTSLASPPSLSALRRPAAPRRTAVAAVLLSVVALLSTVLVSPASALAYDAKIDLTFPVDGSTTFSDSYTACRGAGCERRHMATDIMGEYGLPVHAAMGGTITWITGIDSAVPSYGYMITIRGDDGRDYNYIHLGDQNRGSSSAYAKGIKRGVRVERGQRIGTLGHSGNASRSAPHLHLEIEDSRVTDRYGGIRMNPYASLVDAQKRGDIPGAVVEEVATTGPVVVAGDWFGEGEDGIGWWNDGKVRLRAASGREETFTYGRGGDLPIVGDWDGDGTDTLGIVRDKQWHLRNSHSGGAAQATFTYGKITDGDVPIVGDWNADGIDTPGIIRDGQWHLRNSHSGGNGQEVFTYGRITRGDLPLIGDWRARGTDRPGIVRTQEWHLRYAFEDGAADQTYTYGRVAGGDLPLMGDWNGDGIDTPAIVRDEEFHLKYEHGEGNADQVVRLGRP